MGRGLLIALCIVSACSDGGGGGKGSDGSTYDPPEMGFGLATSGAFGASYEFSTDEINAARSSDGSDDCAGSMRGIIATSPDGLFVDFRIDGCTLLSEGGPSIVVPGQLEVTPPGGERHSSAYFDGAANEFVDGCLVTIADISRWDDSPFHDEHLYITGTYACAELYSGFGEDDTQILVQPGAFSFDWTSSEP